MKKKKIRYFFLFFSLLALKPGPTFFVGGSERAIFPTVIHSFIHLLLGLLPTPLPPPPPPPFSSFLPPSLFSPFFFGRFIQGWIWTRRTIRALTSQTSSSTPRRGQRLCFAGAIGLRRARAGSTAAAPPTCCAACWHQPSATCPNTLLSRPGYNHSQSKPKQIKANQKNKTKI